MRWVPGMTTFLRTVVLLALLVCLGPGGVAPMAFAQPKAAAEKARTAHQEAQFNEQYIPSQLTEAIAQARAAPSRSAA